MSQPKYKTGDRFILSASRHQPGGIIEITSPVYARKGPRTYSFRYVAASGIRSAAMILETALDALFRAS